MLLLLFYRRLVIFSEGGYTAVLDEAKVQQQAKKYQVENIQFIQADILEFSNFPMLFDVIECSGVLHHMENPEQGLQSLSELLSPTGVMKIALYSESARKQVINFRKLITNNKQQTGDDLDQRLLRQALLMNQIPGQWNNITRSEDFYSMSNCRDLIFHEQEHQFTPTKIDNLLSNNQLEFIGMLPTTSALQAFESKLGAGALSNNNTLESWDKVEQSDEDIFAGMYQFYCRKKSNIKIHYKYITYSNHKQHQFEFQINKSDWLDCNSNTIILQNLNSGKQILKIRLKNNHNQSILYERNIEIIPLFYKQFWFITTSILIGFERLLVLYQSTVFLIPLI